MLHAGLTNTIKPVSRTRVLWLLILSQFACVSLWFSGNSVIGDLVRDFSMSLEDMGHLVTLVQIGFIAGTLCFALLAIVDRYSPSKVFFISALAAACCSSLIIFTHGNPLIVYGSRFLTGFFLAGVYPVGMKIAADYFAKDLGKALGYLVGALVLGTALPHLLKYFQAAWPWKSVIMATSLISVLGGLMVYAWIPDGPFRMKGMRFRMSQVWDSFRSRPFKAAAFGYFGHMWEVYTFWTFVPIMLMHTSRAAASTAPSISLYSFIIIAAGGLSCVAGGYAARYAGSYNVALAALIASALCCILSPFLFLIPYAWAIAFLVFWSMVVVMDSPQFSALVAAAAPADQRGTALTMVTCVGFSITVISIQVLTFMIQAWIPEYAFLLLVPGPLAGIWTMVVYGRA